MIDAQIHRRRGQLCLSGLALLAAGLAGSPVSADPGACCISGGGAFGCEVLDPVDCARAGGTFAGEGASCGNSFCTPHPPPENPPRGACCLQFDSPAAGNFLLCIQVTLSSCQTYGGSYQGDEVPCPDFVLTEDSACYHRSRVLVRPGDMNLDGVVNGFDIDIFVESLVNPEGFPAVYPNSNRLIADVNRDGAVDFFDLDPFVALIV